MRKIMYKLVLFILQKIRETLTFSRRRGLEKVVFLSSFFYTRKLKILVLSFSTLIKKKLDYAMPKYGKMHK